jgi:hypothetical protein
MQIFAPGTTMTGLTFNYDVFGPGLNQGLYPSDPVTHTTFNDVSIKTRFSWIRPAITSLPITPCAAGISVMTPFSLPKKGLRFPAMAPIR